MLTDYTDRIKYVIKCMIIVNGIILISREPFFTNFFYVIEDNNFFVFYL